MLRARGGDIDARAVSRRPRGFRLSRLWGIVVVASTFLGIFSNDTMERLSARLRRLLRPDYQDLLLAVDDELTFEEGSFRVNGLLFPEASF
jgi:hypothetical protein